MSKADTERKRHFNAKLHKKRDFLHVHLSKPLKEKLKTKKRALLVRKGDKVKVMRGSSKGKEGKVASVDYVKLKVYLEGIAKRTARGREMLVGFEASNLLLLERGERGKITKEEVKTEIKPEVKETLAEKKPVTEKPAQ